MRRRWQAVQGRWRVVLEGDACRCHLRPQGALRSRVRRRVVAFEDHAFQQRHPQGIGSEVAAFTEVFLNSSEKRGVEGVVAIACRHRRSVISLLGRAPVESTSANRSVASSRRPSITSKLNRSSALATTAVAHLQGKVAGSIAWTMSMVRDVHVLSGQPVLDACGDHGHPWTQGCAGWMASISNASASSPRPSRRSTAANAVASGASISSR